MCSLGAGLGVGLGAGLGLGLGSGLDVLLRAEAGLGLGSGLPRPAKSAFFSVAAAMRLRTASLFGMTVGVKSLPSSWPVSALTPTRRLPVCQHDSVWCRMVPVGMLSEGKVQAERAKAVRRVQGHRATGVRRS